MNLSIQITEADYVDACYLHGRLRPYQKWLFAIAAFVTISAFTIATLAGTFKPRVTLIVLGVLAVYLVTAHFFELPRRAKKIYRQQKALQKAVNINIDADSLQISSDTGSARILWNTLHKWKENKDLILVYHSDALFHMFPKRCFTSESDVVEFQSILTKHLGKPQA